MRKTKPLSSFRPIDAKALQVFVSSFPAFSVDRRQNSLIACMFLQALAYMGDDFMFQLFGKYKDMADAVKLPCHLNMAASLLKLEKYEEAIGHCTTVSFLQHRGVFRANLLIEYFALS